MVNGENVVNLHFFVRFPEGCQTKNCDFYSTCVSDDSGNAQCLCKMDHCEKVNVDKLLILTPAQKLCNFLQDEQPVCGTDNVTYDSRCKLMQTSCEKKIFIVVAFQGKCGKN